MSKALLDFRPAELTLIRQAIPTAKKLNEHEFNLFIELCRQRGLNPITRQVYPFLFDENDEKKRNMTLVVSIDGQRSLAARTGKYRPDPKSPRVKTDKRRIDKDTNPYGIVSAEVAVQVFLHGEWSPAPATVYWEEFAPIIEIWAEDATGKRQPTGKFRIDPKKKAWIVSGRHMLAKVAEIQSLRKAFPDDFGGLYGEEETHASESLASAVMEEAMLEERQKKLGGPAVLTDWLDGEGLIAVPYGKYADAVIAWIDEHADDAALVLRWKATNKAGLAEFWAHHRGDHLAIIDKIDEVLNAETIDGETT